MNRTECITVLREHNLNLIPLKKNEKTPLISWLEYQSKKYEQNIPDEVNLAIICGTISENLVVIDVDIDDQNIVNFIFPDAFNRTTVVKTGKGYHIYVKVHKLPNTLRLENEYCRVDIQSSGTYVVAPTSIHPNGTVYDIISNVTKIETIDFRQIMENLKKIGFKPNKSTRLDEIERHGTKEGSRNNSMFKLTCRYLKELVDETTAFAALQSVNEKNNPPLDQQELENLFESAKRYTPDEKIDESQSLYQFATSKIKRLIISQNNSREVYAVIEINGHMETIELSSARAILWLNHMYRNCQSPKIHGEDFFRNILTAIISDAQMNNTPKEKIYNRIAFVDDTVYYDLVTPDWQIVKITSQSIDIVPYSELMPIFSRTQSRFGQVKPVFGDSTALDKLTELFRIKDKDIFKVHLTTLFLEDIPVPIMVFDGAAGSMKTTTTASIKRIVDPNGTGNDDNCTSMAKNDNLIIQLYNRYMSAFDNVTKIIQEDSDTLCRAITGSGNQKRSLYSNSDESILNFRVKLVLNGIVLNPDFPDLLDRIITYERIPLGENDRLTEKEFQERYNVLLPSVLGQIFTIIHKAISIYHIIKQEIQPKTRLADFEVWGESIARAMNQKSNVFVNQLYEKQKLDSISVRDTHPIIQAIESLMEDKDIYENSALGCLTDLKQIATELGINTESQWVRFPKSPNLLVRELTTVEPILKKIYYSVSTAIYTRSDKRFTKNSKVITIKKIHNKPSPSSLDSLFDNYEQNEPKNGEAVGESNQQTTIVQNQQNVPDDSIGESSDPSESSITTLEVLPN